MKKKIIYFLSFCLITILLYSTQLIANPSNNLKALMDEIDLTNVENVMFVAHPDDESIWGGDKLIKNNYLVVCLTGGSNPIRSAEFFNAMKSINTPAIILDYPDKTFGRRSEWKSTYDQICNDVLYILQQKDWTTIATHNPDGEYGHIQHQLTSKIVTSQAKKLNLTEELMYFGVYYHADEINSAKLENHLSKTDLNNLYNLLSYYSSQNNTLEKLEHMFPFENWISYNEWNEKRP